MLLAFWAGLLPALAAPPQNIAEVRSWSLTEEARRGPFDVPGVLTFCHEIPGYTFGFLQDGSEGIYMALPAGACPPTGHAVTVTAMAAPGDFAPILQVSAVAVGEPMALPPAVPAHTLSIAARDSRLVEMHGEVRDLGMQTDLAMHTLVLLSNGQRTRVDLPDSIPLPHIEALLGAHVTMTGVAATRFNEREQVVGPRLMVPSLDQIQVLTRPDRRPEVHPVTAVSNLLRFGHRDDLVRVRGTVTWVGLDSSLVVQDDTGGVWVRPRWRVALPEVGQLVDVMGYEATNGLSPSLEDAELFPSAHTGSIPPAVVHQTVLDVHRDGTLVELDAVLLGTTRASDRSRTRLQLDHKGTILEAMLAGEAPDLEAGSVLRTRGVLHLEADRNHVHVAVYEDTAVQPTRATLLLRSPDDITVLQGPPWLSGRNAAYVGLGLLFLIAVVTGWGWTLRKQVAQQTTIIRQQLDQQAALAKAADAASHAKSAFLANMSHELRTPMNGVMGIASVLLRQNGLGPDQRELVRVIQSSSQRLLGLLNDLLDFSKIEAGRMELSPCPTELRDCIDETLELYWPRASEKGLALTATIPPSVPGSVQVDPTRLTQILTNLVGNAIRFTDHGEVRVTVTTAGPDRLRIDVTDTGIGLTEAQRGRIFQRFSQADASTTRQFGGTGLGLAISKHLAEQMGGEIDVDSTPGQGSTFWFTLHAPTLRTGPPESARPLAGKKVWVAGLPMGNRTYLLAQLERWGMDVVSRMATADVCVFGPVGLDGPFIQRSVRVPDGPLQSRGLLRSLLHQVGEVAPVHAPDPPTTRPPSLRILLAEDNLVNQLVATRMLELLGLSADVVSDGLAAVEAVVETPYDLVLMDVHMPQCDGIEATRQLRSHPRLAHRQPVIVALTASARQEDRQRCQDAGMDHFLTKPMVPDALADVLSKVMQQRSGAAK